MNGGQRKADRPCRVGLAGLGDCVCPKNSPENVVELDAEALCAQYKTPPRRAPEAVALLLPALGEGLAHARRPAEEVAQQRHQEHQANHLQDAQHVARLHGTDLQTFTVL